MIASAASVQTRSVSLNETTSARGTIWVELGSLISRPHVADDDSPLLPHHETGHHLGRRQWFHALNLPF